MTTQIELSTQQLADKLGISPRMVNIYRAEAERLYKKKIGAKRGRTTYFNSDEQLLIFKVKTNGVDVETVQEQHQHRTSPNFNAVNNQAEDGIVNGMDTIVQAGDQNAIAVGQALGQRWNNLMWTAAIQTMQTGMIQMQQQFSELHTSVSLELGDIDAHQLMGSSSTPALPQADDQDS